MVCLVMIVFAGVKIGGIYLEYAVGVRAYQDLGENYLVAETEDDTAGSSIYTESEMENDKEETEYPNLPDPNKVPVAVDFTALKEQYPDIIAWIYCADTPINYPIVQSNDNEFYLYRLPDGQENKHGTLFMDFRNQADFSDWNNIIYGHNMKNDAMLGILPDYMEQEFYDAHPFWFLLTEKQNYRLDLIGGYVTPADSNTYVISGDSDGRDALYYKASHASTFSSDVKLETDDRLVTLSTCVYDYEDARYVLVGALRELDSAVNDKKEAE